MKLSFLIQLLLLTLLIGVVYLLFTNSIQGKTKMILITIEDISAIVSVIVVIIFSYKLVFFVCSYNLLVLFFHLQ